MTKKDKRPREDQHNIAPQEPPPQGDAGKEPKAHDELAALKDERDDLLARLQRVSADYLNYQKRVQRDIEQAREFANEQLIKSLLGVLDDMERALEAARENHSEDDPLLRGMQIVHDKALETLEQFGVSIIEAVGKIFDPDKHAAMIQEPAGEHPPLTVLRELQKGYVFKGRTIRPSAVVVSKQPEDEQAADSQGQEVKP